MATFKILDRQVGGVAPTFIVAEIGANHNGDIKLAKQSIKAAAECGVDAVKFQTYSAEELLADKNRTIKWKWAGGEVSEPIGEMFDNIALPREAHFEAFEYANELGLIPFSTPFSLKGLSFLVNKLKVPCLKVAASDVNYIDMLNEMGKTGLPIMLSLGKCTLSEADLAINTLIENGCEKLVVMHCVSQYPSPMEEMNLNVIKSLKMLYPEAVIGFSDHSLGITAALGAVALGAKVVEKHFTINKELKGPDHWFSMDTQDMSSLVKEIRNLEMAMGHPRKMVLTCEIEEKERSTRSLVLKKEIKAGEIITEEHIKVVRPGWGISPIDKEKIIGMRTTNDLSDNTVLEWKYFK